VEDFIGKLKGAEERESGIQRKGNQPNPKFCWLRRQVVSGLKKGNQESKETRGLRKSALLCALRQKELL
jgi:hypothetical protein